MSSIFSTFLWACEELWAGLCNLQNVFWTQDAPGPHPLDQQKAHSPVQSALNLSNAFPLEPRDSAKEQIITRNSPIQELLGP